MTKEEFNQAVTKNIEKMMEQPKMTQEEKEKIAELDQLLKENEALQGENKTLREMHFENCQVIAELVQLKEKNAKREK